ncbi:MAG TPA: 50S ribosomal protein L9 [Lachnospiraceae bacterium]|nr:50S ribosomal protein L9 [Lachnospiraceae bacterium]
MKIILLQDVKSLGKKGDVVNVSDGYARNMLLPKKLGVEATPKTLNDLKLQNKHEARLAQEALDAANELKARIENSEIKMTMKIGDNGRAFGSIAAKEIAEEAKKQCGLDIDKKKIVMDGQIKELGKTEVKVKVHPKVTAKLKIDVTEA